MSAKRLEANFENRTYYFNLTHRDEKTITIDMYSTPYTFVRINDTWENHSGNKNNMAKGLILAVVEHLSENKR